MNGNSGGTAADYVSIAAHKAKDKADQLEVLVGLQGKRIDQLEGDMERAKTVLCELTRRFAQSMGTDIP